MYRIRRIYLDGVGHNDAFYRDMLFDFADRQGEANNEVLLNAGNGVGKTSALALIFNTLIPTRSWFIQTMQKRHQKLEDYVHGQPGLILLEFERDDESDLFGHKPRLVVGQYLALQPNQQLYQQLFLFEPSDGGPDFDQVPSPTRSGLKQISAARDWLHNQPLVEFTQTQREWFEKLESRGFDLELIRQMVKFSSREGGISTFAEFRSEQEFLGRFFFLALDQAETFEVRKQLEATVGQLRAQESKKVRHELLSQLINTLPAFAAQAEACNAIEKQTARQQSELAQAAEKTANWRQAAEHNSAQLEQQLKQHKVTHGELTAQQQSQQACHEVLTLQRFALEQGGLEQALNEAGEAHDRAREQRALLDASSHYQPVQLARIEHDTLQQQLEDASEDLAPQQQQVDESKQALALGVSRALRRCETEQAQHSAQRELLAQQHQQAESERSACQRTLGSSEARLVQLKERISEALAAREPLQQQGILSEEQSAEQALEQHSAQQQQLEQQVRHSQDSQQDLQQQLSALGEQQQTLQQQIAASLRDSDRLQAELERAADARQALAGSADYIALCGQQSPDDRDAADRLHGEREGLKQLHNQLQIELAQLSGRILRLEQSGTLLVDEQVARAAAWLRERRVECQPFAGYLAQALTQAGTRRLSKAEAKAQNRAQETEQGDAADKSPSAASEAAELAGRQIRRLICQDPARYLGLVVFSREDFDRARLLLEQYDLAQAPVTVTLFDDAMLDSEGEQESQSELSFSSLVLAPADPGWYGEQQAGQVLERWREQYQRDMQRLTQTEKQQEQLAQLGSRLAQYQSEFSAARQAKWQQGLRQQREEQQELEQELQGCHEAQSMLRDKQQQLTSRQGRLQQQQLELLSQLEMLRHYRQHHEQPLAGWQADAATLEAEQSQSEQQLEQLSAQLLTLSEQQTTLAQASLQSQSDSRELSQLREKLDLALVSEPDGAADADAGEAAATDADQSLPALRARYEAGLQLLSQAREQSGLGQLQRELEGKARLLDLARERFEENNPQGLSSDDCQAFLVRHPVPARARPEIEREEAACSRAVLEAERALKESQKAARKAKKGCQLTEQHPEHAELAQSLTSLSQAEQQLQSLEQQQQALGCQIEQSAAQQVADRQQLEQLQQLVKEFKHLAELLEGQGVELPQPTAAPVSASVPPQASEAGNSQPESGDTGQSEPAESVAEPDSGETVTSLMLPLPEADELEPFSSRIKRSGKKLQKLGDDEKAALLELQRCFEPLREQILSDEFKRADESLYLVLHQLDCSAFYHRYRDLQQKLEQRAASLNQDLVAYEQHLAMCAESLVQHTQKAATMLHHAVNRSRLPVDLSQPSLCNKPVLRISSKLKLNSLSVDQLREPLKAWVRGRIQQGRLPEVSADGGDQLSSELLTEVARLQLAQEVPSLGLKMIKFNASAEYNPVDKLTGSGGQTLTTALMLYLVMAELRAMRQSNQSQSHNRGWLMLDNPLGECSSAELVQPQIEMARQLGFQLIYLSAIDSPNTTALFRHKLMLRRGRRDIANSRDLIEITAEPGSEPGSGPDLETGMLSYG